MRASLRLFAAVVPFGLLAVGCSADFGDDTPGTTTQAVRASNAAVCPGPAAPGSARCHARVVVDPITGEPAATGGPSGYAPSDLRDAYGLTGTGTSSQIIAVVVAYDYPSAESDLATYRSTFGLSACTTANGCFRRVNQKGTTTKYPRGNSGWSQEAALDLDMASAICPGCKLLLVEANSPYLSDLGSAVNTAADLGATVINNSFGASEFSSEQDYETAYYIHPGVPITVSSGDGGYGVEFPAASRYVTAVGGTSLTTTTANTRGWTEAAWDGAGSGCSAYIPKPSWQEDSGCTRRAVADVSAVADPATGVAVYWTQKRRGGWLVFGGTSVAAPLVAGVYALAANNGTAAMAYSHTSALFDVVSGSNGTCGGSYLCTATNGYDGPTGLGTPNGTAAF